MPAQTGLTQPIAPQPTFTPRSGPPPSGGTSRRPANGPGNRPGKPRGRGADRRSPAPGGRLSRIWQGSLRGGLGVWVIVGSALIGAIATIVTKSQPGSVLGLFVLAGTVAAALTVQPRTGRLNFPVPASTNRPSTEPGWDLVTMVAMAPIRALPTMTQTPSPPRSEPSQIRLSRPPAARSPCHFPAAGRSRRTAAGRTGLRRTRG
jgi:hypothetical protein